MRPVGVCSGFALRPIGVRSGSARADPDRTPKANPRSGLGPLYVRLGPVVTVSSMKLVKTFDALEINVFLKSLIYISWY